jgi:RHS repeat-associated protein
MRLSKYFLLIVLATCFASAQRQASLPPFGSYGGGPFDTVNLGNLDVHFTIPVLHKAGRGLPFSYDISYDGSVWTPVTSSGTTQWQPTNSFGWSNISNAGTGGYISYSVAYSGGSCPINPPYTFGTYTEVEYYGFVYHDGSGFSHPLYYNTYYITQTSGCTSPPNGPQPATPVPIVAADGSGYTMYATPSPSSVSAYLVTRNGTAIFPYLVSGPPGGGSWSETDANGNMITESGGTWTDTLGSQVLALVGTAPSNTTLTYIAPSGANASYTVSYTKYTVQTWFQTSGISEYGPQSNPLVSGITLPDGSSYSFTYEATSTAAGCTPISGTYSGNCITGRIASVTLPTGGSITYTYSGGSNGIESDGSTAGLSRTLSPGGEWQYSRSLSGSTWTTTVTSPPDPVNTGSASDVTVINFAKDSSGSTQNYYETQRWAYQGSNSPSNLLAMGVRCYNTNYASCGTASVSSPITQTDIYSQLPNGTSTRLSEVKYNANSLVTDSKEYNYGVSLGSAPSSTYLVKETSVSYATLGNGIVGKPATVTVQDWTNSGATLASATYTYDGNAIASTTGTPQHTSISGSRGNLTSLATQANSSGTTLYQSFTYYDTGNPYVVTGVNGAQTTYVYGTTTQGSSTISCGNSFATTINEPLSLSKSITWNCTGGTATQITDENGKNATSTYSDTDFWRPASVFDQANNETTINYASQTAVEAALQNFNSGNSASDSRTTVDGFGRPILSQRLQGPGATQYDTAETDYNVMGQAYRSTMPFSATAGSTSSTAPSTTTTYDALGRVLTIMDAAGGTVSYTYTNNDVLQKVSGTQTFQKQFEYDGLGRLSSVCEMTTLTGSGTCLQANNVTGFWTTYTYDALGRLLTVTQNKQGSSQQTRAFAYDMLGRMTSESNPETGNGGTNGTVSYTYDSISPCADGSNHSYPGDLVQKKDNAGNYTCYSYDALHRVVAEGNSSVTNTILRKFFYDSESSYPTGVTVINAKTHLVEAQTLNTTNLSVKVTDEFFSYSPRGELTDVYESTPHSSGFYHTTATYWPTGALETLSGIPGVPTIYYGASNGTGLDGEGRVTKVTASTGTSPVTGVTYYTSGTAEPLGALTKVTFGSADNDSFTYDTNTGRMKTYTFSVNSQTDKGTLTWNTNGTLNKLVIADQLNTTDTQTCNYAYDDLQRLSSASCGSLWAQTFTYDLFGNITKSGNVTFNPLYSATQNQFTSIPGVTSPYYDQNGNLVKDNLNTYTWDPNWGNMLTVNTGSTTVTATYDALGRMVENNAGGTYTELIYGPTGAKVATANGTTLIKAFVALPGGAKAIYNSSGTLAYYRHSDWLGSSRLTSTASRTVYSSSAYAPFGEQYAISGTADASFTGQDQDTVSSLYDFLARRYSPSQGRWISPDPLGRGAVSLTNPQTWNRYVYVINNPLRLIDRVGLCGDDDDDIGGSAGDDDDDGNGELKDSLRRGHSSSHHNVRAMDEEGCGDDGSDDDDGNPPCVGIGAGIDTNMDDSYLNSYSQRTGAAVVFPYDTSDGTITGDETTDGITDVLGQNIGRSSASDTMANFVNGLTSANDNVVLLLYSGSAQAFTTSVNNGDIGQQALSKISQIIYVSPGAPTGLTFTNVPTAVYMANPSNPLEAAVVGPTLFANGVLDWESSTNLNGGGIIWGCGHDLQCDIKSGLITQLPDSSDCNEAQTTGDNLVPSGFAEEPLDLDSWLYAI